MKATHLLLTAGELVYRAQGPQFDPQHWGINSEPFPVHLHTNISIYPVKTPLHVVFEPSGAGGVWAEM